MTNYLSILFLVICFLSACSVQPVKVEGITMLPTLSNGDRILVDKNLNDLKRGDIITLLYPKDQTKSYIKRIIGLPGETIEIRQGKTYINGDILDEPYLNETYNQAKSSFSLQKVPNNQYFVMGDNRDNSADSRTWGMLDKKLVTSRYYTTYSKAEN